MNEPFYDPTKSYEDNYTYGPFGPFQKTVVELPPSKHSCSLFGIPLDIPFGIPAGPLLNGKFIKGAWNWGFSIATYKTVRNEEFPCHPFPNVIKVSSNSENIKPGDVVLGDLHVESLDVVHDGITNSFGVPSKPSSEWESDVKVTLLTMNQGNTLILSFMGTKKEEMTRDQYIADFVKTAMKAKNTGAPILEVNFSCPNFGKEGLICNDLQTSRDILEAMHKAKGSSPLLVKIGYFSSTVEHDLELLISAIHDFADGVVAINTIAADVVDSEGKQILPGSPVRLKSGICGSKIRWAGLEMAERIMNIKNKNGWNDFVVIGCGGVTTVDDCFMYKKIGVNAVMSATGAMWKPELAIEIRESDI